MKKQTKNKEVKDVIQYKAIVKVLGRTYESTGTSIYDAIAGLKPTNCKGRGILTVQCGDVKKDRILTNVATYRLFNSHGLTREVALKNTSNLFNGI